MPTKEFITIQSNMKRQGYQRPEMLVVELRQRSSILAGSGEGLGKSASMSVTYDEEDI
jgi:hypothetical protein